MSPKAESLRDALSEFDGRALTLLTEARARFQGPGFVDSLIALCSEGELAVGATWLIKHELEQGTSLSAMQTRKLIRAAKDWNAWQAELHLCQSIQFLQLSKAHVRALGPWLEPRLCHARPFLRAWSLDALVRVSFVEPALVGRADEALRSAADDAPSVQARARKLAKLRARASKSSPR